MQSSSDVCLFTLRLLNSQAISLKGQVYRLLMLDSIADSIDVRHVANVNISNSLIDTILHADFHFYPSAINGSLIRKIYSLNITSERLLIRNSEIRTIGPGSILFSGKELIFENVTISNILPRGVEVLSGKLRMINCSINHLSNLGIQATDINTIEMTDVTFGKIESPGFRFESSVSVSFKNTIAEGSMLTATSRHIDYGDGENNFVQPSKSPYRISQFPDEYCSHELAAIKCNFTDSQQV